jgi:hypothetical protein
LYCIVLTKYVPVSCVWGFMRPSSPLPGELGLIKLHTGTPPGELGRIKPHTGTYLVYYTPNCVFLTTSTSAAVPVVFTSRLHVHVQCTLYVPLWHACKWAGGISGGGPYTAIYMIYRSGCVPSHFSSEDTIRGVIMYCIVLYCMI